MQSDKLVCRGDCKFRFTVTVIGVNHLELRLFSEFSIRIMSLELMVIVDCLFPLFGFEMRSSLGVEFFDSPVSGFLDTGTTHH